MKSQISNLKSQINTNKNPDWKFEIGNLKLEILAILLLTFTFYLLPSTAYAASSGPSLGVSPIIVNLDLTPGKSTTQIIIIHNLLDIPLPVRASFSEFDTADEDGGYVFDSKPTNSMLSWLSLSESNFILPAKSFREVTVKVTMPKNIPVGGYYSMLFFEPLMPIVQGTTRVTTRIGVLFLGNIGVISPGKKVEIPTFSLGGFFHENSQLPLLLRVRNISLHTVSAKPILTLSPLLGTTSKQTFEDRFLFPGKVRRWTKTVILPNALPNIYKASIGISTGNGEQEKQETYFIVFPFTSVFVILFAAGLIIISIKKRRQIKHAIHIIVKG